MEQASEEISDARAHQRPSYGKLPRDGVELYPNQADAVP